MVKTLAKLLHYTPFKQILSLTLKIYLCKDRKNQEYKALMQSDKNNHLINYLQHNSKQQLDMKKFFVRGAFLSVMAILTLGLFGWTEHRTSSINKVIAGNVEALTQQNGGADPIPITSEHSCITFDGDIYFTGWANKTNNKKVLPGCEGTGVCDAQAWKESGSEGGTDGWASWLNTAGATASIASLILGILMFIFG